MNSSALVINNLTKTYSNGHKALHGIDLDIQHGDFFALLGPNGAGKSTTIGIVSSLVSKSGGKVRICGIDIDEDRGCESSALNSQKAIRVREQLQPDVAAPALAGVLD